MSLNNFTNQELALGWTCAKNCNLMLRMVAIIDNGSRASPVLCTIENHIDQLGRYVPSFGQDVLHLDDIFWSRFVEANGSRRWLFAASIRRRVYRYPSHRDPCPSSTVDHDGDGRCVCISFADAEKSGDSYYCNKGD